MLPTPTDRSLDRLVKFFRLNQPNQNTPELRFVDVAEDFLAISTASGGGVYEAEGSPGLGPQEMMIMMIMVVESRCRFWG